MCGIFGSTDIKTFRELYTKNSERGNFVRSITMVFPGGMKDDIRVSTKYEQDFNKHIEENPFCIYYLGHVQSPTSKVRTFNENTSHPFTYKNTYLAHNGVLQNFNELKEKQIDPNKINGLEFMQMFANSKLTNIKTIERMRRKLQEEHPELRGKLYVVRKETIQDQWRKDLGYGNGENN